MSGILVKLSYKNLKRVINHVREFGIKYTLEKCKQKIFIKKEKPGDKTGNYPDTILSPGDSDSVRNIVYVGHDANFYGAQLLSLYIIKTLTRKFKFKVHLILKQGGELEDQYKKYAILYNIQKDYQNNDDLARLIEKLYKKGADIAIANTVVCGDIVELLSKNKIRTVSLVHELTNTIKSMNAEEAAKAISKYADKIVFPSEFVQKGFEEVSPVDFDKVIIRPQGFYLKNRFKNKKDEARIHLRNLLNIEQESSVIIGLGAGNHRKGIDLFFDTAKKVNRRDQKTYFVWVGNLEGEFTNYLHGKSKADLFKNNIILLEPRNDISFFYAGADLFLMTSREDPFPSVVLEAMDVGLPVIGFRDAGGFADIVSDQTGALVPYCDTDAMARKVQKLMSDKELRAELGVNASQLIKEKFNFDDYIYLLLELLGHKYEKVSIVVPNYNYGKYIEQRLNGIINQTYPIYDLVILDDRSKDDSVKVIEQFLIKKDLTDEVIFIKNSENSGSVFKQWQKGVVHSKGNYIWIAEADDLCENTFLEKVMTDMKDSEIVLGYTQSKQIDSEGEIIGYDYLEYTNDIDPDKWKKDYVNNGISEITNALSVKNTIPNVSAVVFRRPEDISVFEGLDQYKIAGDWYFYVRLLEKGNILFIAEALNIHRRHAQSVTLSENNELHFREIVSLQEYICQKYMVNESIRAKILKYREEVRQHLGVR